VNEDIEPTDFEVFSENANLHEGAVNAYDKHSHKPQV
jgi:hypothetical protein